MNCLHKENEVKSLSVANHRTGAPTTLGVAVLLAIAAWAPQLAQAQTYTRTDQIVYHDNLTSWVLGQQVSSTNTNTGVVEFKTDYDPVTALPLRRYGPGTAATSGKLIPTSTYYADGTLATVKDGNNNVATLTDWYRGIPRNILYADSAVESAIVNPQGWITSVTNAAGSKTCYEYDAMGRLSRVTYPSETTAGVCDASAWNEEVLYFVPTTAQFGIPAGHWAQVHTRGAYRKITHFDALWRPIFVQEEGEPGTVRFTRQAFDHDGRAVFSSYPVASASAITDLTKGAWTVYDALGRVTASSQDSELGLLTTTTNYAPGFQTHVTNPRNYTTITEYQAYDQPSYDSPAGVTQSAGADTSATEIHRDVFGKVQRIRKRNADGSLFVDRHYGYNDYQELCRSQEPETGTTLMGYDTAGNLKWSASGLPAGQACESNGTTTAVAARRSDRTYDNRNRLQDLAFPGGSGNQTWQYWADGLPRKITTHNDGLNAGVVENDYVYNKRRLLTGESSTQLGWYTWGLGYGYDGNGSLSTQTYPTGLVISYGPNALGQATRASDQTGYSYAYGATYYPNGALKQFTYANGLTHSMTQNARQLPDRVTGSGLAMDFSYRYDANGNVNQIYDHVPDMIPGSSPKYRLMEYDGLDRLTAAGSAMFGGDHWHRFTYDALDNMKSWKLAGIKDYAEYVYTQNRLTNIKNSAHASIVGLDYDVQGNLANKNGQAYLFDYGNRLRSIVNKENYRYDGHGRRVLAWEVASTQSILSMYANGGQLMYEENYRPNAQKATEHIYLAGSIIASRDRGIVTNVYSKKYQHTDALGSPVAVTNEAGTVIERNDYEPYGAVIGKPNYQGIGYTGHVQDGATGLTYMQQRYYDPQVGVFLSVDPVTAYDKGDYRFFNRYAYAFNNPYKFTDPDGRCPSCAGAAIGFGLDLAIQLTEMAMGARTEISGTSLLVSAGSGALGVGLAGKFGQIGGMVVDAAISAGSTAAKGEQVTVLGVVADVALGKAGGDMAAKAITGSASHKVAQRQAGRLQRIGDKPGARTAQQKRARSAGPALKQDVAQKSAQAGVVAAGAGQAVVKDVERRIEDEK